MQPAKPELQTMDWYSWLSKSTLDPSLIYEYGITFPHNELLKEDVAYFNHEFLQSMGISVAKHRLDILKLAKKEVGQISKSLSKLILAISKTKKCFYKYVHKLVHHENNAIKLLPAPEPVRYKDDCKGAFSRNCKSEKELKVKQPAVVRTMKIAKFGSLDYRGQEKLLVLPRILKLSGPLDRNMQENFLFNYRGPISYGPIDIAMAQERLMLTNRIPKLSGPLNYVRPPSPKIHGDYKANGECEDHTLWATLFQEMKPT